MLKEIFQILHVRTYRIEQSVAHDRSRLFIVIFDAIDVVLIW